MPLHIHINALPPVATGMAMQSSRQLLLVLGLPMYSDNLSYYTPEMMACGSKNVFRSSSAICLPL